MEVTGEKIKERQKTAGAGLEYTNCVLEPWNRAQRSSVNISARHQSSQEPLQPGAPPPFSPHVSGSDSDVLLVTQRLTPASFTVCRQQTIRHM